MNIVKRSRYIVIDRQSLAYLNIFEKINCMYCGYANGVYAFAREIAGRTEMYWCPIKHAHKVLDSHRYYPEFSAFGDADNYRKHLTEIRKKIQKLEDKID